MLQSKIVRWNILFLGTTLPSTSNRCSDNILGQNVCICLSTNLPDTQSFRTHQTVPVQIDINSTTVAEASLVHITTSDVYSLTNTSTTESRSTETTQIGHFSSQARSIQSQCMATIDKQFRSEGFSQKVRKLLSASWRTGTQRDYTCKFQQFNSWCCQREIDPYSISLTQCAEFLAGLFNKGLKYRTIAGYRSMLSSVLPPVKSIPNGQHPYII